MGQSINAVLQPPFYTLLADPKVCYDRYSTYLILGRWFHARSYRYSMVSKRS